MSQIYTISKLPEEKFSFSKLLTPVSEEELENYFSFYGGNLSRITPCFGCMGAYKYNNQIIYKYKEQNPWTVYYYCDTTVAEMSDNKDKVYRPIWILERHKEEDGDDNYILIAPRFKEESVNDWLDNYKEVKWLVIYDTIPINDHVAIISQIPENGFDFKLEIGNPIM